MKFLRNFVPDISRKCALSKAFIVRTAINVLPSFPFSRFSTFRFEYAELRHLDFNFHLIHGEISGTFRPEPPANNGVSVHAGIFMRDDHARGIIIHYPIRHSVSRCFSTWRFIFSRITLFKHFHLSYENKTLVKSHSLRVKWFPRFFWISDVVQRNFFPPVCLSLFFIIHEKSCVQSRNNLLDFLPVVSVFRE